MTHHPTKENNKTILDLKQNNWAPRMQTHSWVSLLLPSRLQTIIGLLMTTTTMLLYNRRQPQYYQSSRGGDSLPVIQGTATECWVMLDPKNADALMGLFSPPSNSNVDNDSPNIDAPAGSVSHCMGLFAPPTNTTNIYDDNCEMDKPATAT
jgi:hypothetical protein